MCYGDDCCGRDKEAETSAEAECAVAAPKDLPTSIYVHDDTGRRLRVVGPFREIMTRIPFEWTTMPVRIDGPKVTVCPVIFEHPAYYLAEGAGLPVEVITADELAAEYTPLTFPAAG